MLIFTLAVVFYDIFKFQEEKKKFRGYPDDSRWQILKSSNIYFNYFTSWHSIHAETFADTGNFSLEMVYIYIYVYNNSAYFSWEFRVSKGKAFCNLYTISCCRSESLRVNFAIVRNVHVLWTHARYVFSHDRLSFWTIAQDQVPLRIFPALGNICSGVTVPTPISPILCNETRCFDLKTNTGL